MAVPVADKYPQLRSHLVIAVDGDRGFTTSCMNCRYFDELGQSYTGQVTDPRGTRVQRKPETCCKFEMRPPAKIIAWGCPDYEDENSIPF